MELEIKNKGFTIIEIIVALAVFSLLVVSMAGIALPAIKSQRRAFALQNTQESARYILESMNKEIRMSEINTGDSGGSQVALLNITNHKDETFNYGFDNINKELLRWGQLISPANLEVTGGFYIKKGSSPAWANVTIVMKVKSTGSKPEGQTEIYLQSTTVPRSY